MGVMFLVMVAATFGAKRLLEIPSVQARLRPAMLLAAAVPALAIAVVAGQLPPAFGADGYLFNRTPATGRLLAATSVIPPNAPVYADDGAAVWPPDRPLIPVLPSQLPPARYIVIDRQDWKHRLQASAARADGIPLPSARRPQLPDDDPRVP